jgi:hypothetical protein
MIPGKMIGYFFLFVKFFYEWDRLYLILYRGWEKVSLTYVKEAIFFIPRRPANRYFGVGVM